MWMKQVYCSPVLGTLLLKGEPLSNVEVVREVVAAGLPGGRLKDRVLTNSRGQFEFPQIAQRAFQFPFQGKREVSILQTLTVDVEGYSYCIWAYGKSDHDLGSETGQPEIRLTCELAGTSQGHQGEFYSTRKPPNFREVACAIEGQVS